MKHPENSEEYPEGRINDLDYERRFSYRKKDPVMRFKFDGFVHQTLDWNSYGFRIMDNEKLMREEGDSFIIRGIGYGNLEMIPVTIRAEIQRRGNKSISVRFLQNALRDRKAFENFITRSGNL